MQLPRLNKDEKISKKTLDIWGNVVYNNKDVKLKCFT